MDVLGCLDVVNVLHSLRCEFLCFNHCLGLHLIQQLLLDEDFLSLDSSSFFFNHFISLLGAEMGLEVLLLHLLLELLSLSVILDLLCEVGEILKVVPSLELSLVLCYKVFFVLLPSELLPFELPDVLELLALLLEALVSLLVSLGEILNVVLTLGLGMVVDFEGTLGAHKVWVSLTVVIV